MPPINNTAIQQTQSIVFINFSFKEQTMTEKLIN